VALGMALVLAIRIVLRAEPPARLPQEVPGAPKLEETEPARAPKLDVMPYAVLAIVAAAFVSVYLSLLSFGFSTVKDAVDLYAADPAGKEPEGHFIAGLVDAVNEAGGWPLLGAIFALLLAVGWEWWLRTFARFNSEWWLGEVGRRVYVAYDVPWSSVATAIRFRPLPQPRLRNPFVSWWPWRWRLPVELTYKLVVATGGGRKGVRFRITVPGDEGQPIKVEGFDPIRKTMVVPRRRKANEDPALTGSC
jgi:hypothetical protein